MWLRGMNWFEKNLGVDWVAILTWIVIGALALIGGAVFYGVPKYQYAHASLEERCQIDLKKMHDEDKYCDSNNSIQSQKAVAEAARRAALTPKQRCEEDNKSGSEYDLDGNVDGYLYVSCHDDGTYTVKSSEELQNDYEQAQTDYYDSIQSSDCLPNYSPCVPDAGYDLDCPQIGHQVHVIGPDIYHLDADGDGIGCESY